MMLLGRGTCMPSRVTMSHSCTSLVLTAEGRGIRAIFSISSPSSSTASLFRRLFWPPFTLLLALAYVAASSYFFREPHGSQSSYFLLKLYLDASRMGSDARRAQVSS